MCCGPSRPIVDPSAATCPATGAMTSAAVGRFRIADFAIRR